MFYLAGISIALFLSLLILGKRQKTYADKILAIWLVIIGIHLFFYYANLANFIFDFPWLLGIHLPIPLLHGPLLFLYSSALTGNLKIKHFWLHFIPAILDYHYLIPFFLLSGSEKIHVYKSEGAEYNGFLLMNILAIILSGILYVIANIGYAQKASYSNFKRIFVY